MEIKRYDFVTQNYLGSAMEVAPDGEYVLWSDVEPLLLPLTDEQVRKLSYRMVSAARDLAEALGQVRDERDAKELSWKEADAAESAVHADYIGACRAALKEAGR